MSKTPWRAAKLTLSAVLMTTTSLLAQAAVAQTAPTAAPDSEDLSAIIVTGTRLTGLRVVDSPAPIEIVDAGSLERAGKTDLSQALAASVPSFTTQSFGGDAGNLKLSARLRGLSPNHALILLNGKRRHGTSNLTVALTGGFAGAASADLAFIPVASIDHVEVLTDGAAAQYGTDAIAGVINIIQKKNYKGGMLSLTGGAYGEGDGETVALTGNLGIGTNRAFFNTTFEYRFHDYSNRGAADRRVYNATNIANPVLPRLKDYPYLNKIFGDAKYQMGNASYNAGFDLNDEVQLYTFGSYGYRYGIGEQNYRFPNISPTFYPLGFSPKISAREHDYGITAGVRTLFATGWNADLSTTYGGNRNRMGSDDTVNNTLVQRTGTSPTDFYVGSFLASQWTSNLDVTHDFDVGFSKPLSLALGAEYRHETFEIKSGDPQGLVGVGLQAYPAFAPTDAGAYSRNNYGLYGDVAFSPMENLQLDLAGRFEHFSDFGDTKVVKGTARYDFTPIFAVRGTASTGFRAPTLAESYYSATVISPTSAGVRLPPNAASARLLGIAPLDSEDSTNLSLGAVFNPTSRLSATFDIYQINIDNRIVQTGSIFGRQNFVLRSAEVTAAIVANGNFIDPTVQTTSISTLVNGADTRTRGAELVVNYRTSAFGEGKVDWSIAANYNKTKVTKIYTPSAQVAASGQRYLDPTAISYLETAAPRFKIVFGALYQNEKWILNLRNSLYGKSSIMSDGGSTSVYVKNDVKAAVITDLDISYNITSALRMTIGGVNIFDKRPDKLNPLTLAASLAQGGNGVVDRQSFGSYGINGGYYYGKLSVNF